MIHSFLEQVGKVVVKLISVLFWPLYFRKVVDIPIVAWYALNVGAGTAHRNRFDDFFTHFLSQFAIFFKVIIRVSLQSLELLVKWCKKRSQIANTINRTPSRVLKQQQFGVYIHRGIIHRGRRNEDHLFLVTFDISDVHAWHLADFL